MINVFLLDLVDDITHYTYALDEYLDSPATDLIDNLLYALDQHFRSPLPLVIQLYPFVDQDETFIPPSHRIWAPVL